ncbi:furin-like protease 1, isoforms 1/1-X/2 [Centruroides vittatus]|uniref:furin-like protease 1, isoforms 1/1-X/2 n=1 Tax=Centruroides vittatus TaxID=120091 RepID=UPI0035108431
MCYTDFRFFILRVLLSLSVLTIALSVIYTDQFVVRVSGDEEVAKELARKYDFTYLSQIFPDYYHFQHRKVAKRSADFSAHHHRKLRDDPQVKWFSQQTLKRRVKKSIRYSPIITLSDPDWSEMWYLNRGPGLDMNVQEVWAQGVTGKNVVVTILNDGLEKDHPDIAQNYDPEASFDINDHDPDPQPRYDLLDTNSDGTRCAGEVAAQANNSFCAVGVAYGAKVGGVKMLDGDVTDVVEARSLSLNRQHIDIYSASWGPNDDGKTVEGPGVLATRAFTDGIKYGRRGLGSIFIWASGIGGREHDNCNCDGYTNAIWTVSVNSATENGLVPWYSEACSSTLATTYSSGFTGERRIVTTDLRQQCTSSHGGTAVSASLAAGICALALEVNNKLTWRDMQHIVVRTARPENLHSKDWKINGVGRNVSHSFGYGLMDAAAMVDLSRRWVTVPQQKSCEIKAYPAEKYVPAKSYVELKLNVYCESVRYLEHVQAKITLIATRRGDIHIYLTSPRGTRSTLLAQRKNDDSRSGFEAWPFMTVHNWGENPNGEWKLEIHNVGRYFGRATLKDWSLTVFGTYENPDVPRVTTTTTTTSRSKPITTTTTTTVAPTTKRPRKTTTRSTTTTTSTTPFPTVHHTHQYYSLTSQRPPVYFLYQNAIEDEGSGN